MDGSTAARASHPEPSDLEDDVDLRLDSGGFSLDVEFEDDDDQIDEPFDPEQIDVRTRTMTIDLLLQRLRRGALDLAPEFQRRAGIWKPKNQSRLIESLLLRIPLPSFYAAENAEEEWAVVDGVQRLTTIARFISPRSVSSVPLVLNDLEYLNYNGFSFEDLPGRLQTRLVETEVLVHLIGKTTPEEVKFNIFGRINTGGIPLSRQELRHALIPGRARDLLPELAASPAFQKATQGSVRDARMSDCEMVLRFLAFRLFSIAEYGSRDLDDFLRAAMKNLNNLDDSQLRALEQDFTKSMEASYAIFGEHAFRKRARGQQQRNPINKALFEAVSVNVAARTPEQISRLIEQRDTVLDKLSDLLADKQFNDAISVATGDRNRVKVRFNEIDQLFKAVAGA
ncbi:DUF262 domain-containing protein [Saccharomonospora iraqiensis]|uniref:DUF262 domain-containing protein n=1 Tax=Saccharomonospora iraqiensis TaxID=52698 RepID=UPI00022E7BF5|nr:DUF262 domain-containing protein [Saccharomonospora iraqiensis]